MAREKSRYQFCEIWLDEQQRLFSDARKPFRYRAFEDNTIHLVKAGESIFSIAGQHFDGQPRPAGLWWVIADFQPEPMHDPTVQLVPGTTLVLPSIQKVVSYIFDQSRSRESRV